MTTYLKVLGPDNRSCHGGDFDWTDYLPDGDTPGKPLPTIADPLLCERGWHWCTPESLMRDWAQHQMRVYEATPEGITADHDGKYVSSSGRLLRPYPLPEWWQASQRFILEEIPAVRWLTQHDEPLPKWRVSLAPTLDRARDQARDQVWNQVWNQAGRQAGHQARNQALDQARDQARAEAWNQARVEAWTQAGHQAWAEALDQAGYDAALYTVTHHICADLPLDQCHHAHAAARWEVWTRGWALYGEVDGVLYVYGVAR
jgi:hypothetical protein